MEKAKHLENLAEIRAIMDRSTQFISLSGLSGIMAGTYALIGSGIVYQLISNHPYHYITIESFTFKMILLTAFIVLVLSILTAYFLTQRKARKSNEKLWNQASKRMLINFIIPLVTGGIFIILLISNKIYGLIGPVSLIFYGLACVNASKFTLRAIHYLGICQIVLGLLAAGFPGNSLYFWAFGFGVLHIFYGTLMHSKYDRKKAE
jgi:hypothetical protein